MESPAKPTISGFKPGLMQWILGGLILLASVAPMITQIAQGMSVSLLQIVLLVVLIGAWGFWVWRQPNGGSELVIPLLAMATAFLVGAIVIALAAGESGDSALDRLLLAERGYMALIDGAFLKKNALTDTLVSSTPLILTGLSVTLGFRAGLFNIGAEGQYLIGAVCGVWVGYAFQLPPILHAIAALVAGALGGALWGLIPGILKAKLGAHELINTIMMNFIAIQLTDWLVNNPMKDPLGPSTIRTPFIRSTANIPMFSEIMPGVFDRADRLHLGFIIALLAAVGVWWLLWKTTLGFELRTNGSNPDAARYAGVKPDRTTILAMVMCGALAGLAGTIDIQGLNRTLPAFFSAGYGFDAIAIALLGQTHPLGVVPSAIIFGALSTGSAVLQIRTGVSHHMISIIQALILLFVAAPAMIRWMFRLRIGKGEMEEVPLTRGWGS
jgi:simple sugar transport system permease protein